MNYSVIYSQSYGVWTVGYFSRSKEWVAMQDFDNQAAADKYCDDLNQGLEDFYDGK
jgi:hypothetical protein